MRFSVALALGALFLTPSLSHATSPYWRVYVTVTGDEHYGFTGPVTSTVSNQFATENSQGAGWIGPALSGWTSFAPSTATFPIFKSTVQDSGGPAGTSGIFYSGLNDPLAPYGTSADITVQYIGTNPPSTASIKIDGTALVSKSGIRDVGGTGTIAYCTFSMMDYVTNTSYPQQALQSPSLSTSLYSDTKSVAGSITAPITNGYGHFHVTIGTQDQISIPSINNILKGWNVSSVSTIDCTISQ